jgi:hypothetical protein
MEQALNNSHGIRPEMVDLPPLEVGLVVHTIGQIRHVLPIFTNYFNVAC